MPNLHSVRENTLGSRFLLHTKAWVAYIVYPIFSVLAIQQNTNGFNDQNQCELENGHPMNLMTMFKNPAIFANLLETIVYI
jgi:hypothetical protein